MPRGGPPSNTYSLPAVYLAVPGTTILATQHNSPLEDIADVLNEPWPTNLGGTGGTSAITSWDAINSRGSNVPTASTIDLDAVTGPNVHLTGTTTVTAVSLSNGAVRYAVADSAFTITAGASLVVNGSTTTPGLISAGSILCFVGGSAGVVYVNSGAGGASAFGYTTTATAAGTTTLTVASTYQQFFTGTTTQTVTLPVTSTLSLGFSFRIVNNSTGIVTVNSSGGNAVVALNGGTQAVVTCILTSGTTAASWAISYIPATSNANSNTLSVSSTAAGTIAALTSTDAGASVGPVLDLYRNSASPATADVLGKVSFNGRSNPAPTSNKREYAAITASISSATDTSEYGILSFSIMQNGSSADYVVINGNAGVGLSGVEITVPLNISGASAGQIRFPSTQNASTNANTLDDYEEGTFTPGMTFNNSSTGVTYSSQSGRYLKIGKYVFVKIVIVLTSNGTGVGNARITGLPFTVADDCALPVQYYANLSAATAIMATTIAGGTEALLQIPAATQMSTATDTNITNTATVAFSGWYEASA